jgi:transcriptional regulator with XRE-family HTH domain
MIHRGEEVKKILTLKGVNLTSLADRIGISRTTVYNQLERHDMMAYYIHKIGKDIGFDFSKVIKNLEKEDPDFIMASEPKEDKYIRAEDHINMSIKLDGSDESLDRLITKLRALNDTVRQFAL